MIGIDLEARFTHQVLQKVLDKIEIEPPTTTMVFVDSNEMEQMKAAQLVHPYRGFAPTGLSPEEEKEAHKAFHSDLFKQGVRILACPNTGEINTTEVADLRELVEMLSGAGAVSEKEEKHSEEHKPQGENTKWQDEIQKGKPYITPKYEDTVQLAIRIEENTRDKFHAVMRAKNTTAQEFLSQKIADEVNNNPDLVKKGEQMEAAGTKKNYRTKLQILKEENTRLRQLTGAGSSPHSR